MRVVLATHNANKVREFQGILGRMLPELEIVAYDGPEPVEDGTSFDENALIKARAAAAHTGLPALADDSGICVDVLGGAPGIFSARWAGHGRGAQANLELLLDQLADIAPEHRAARFACHIALVVPETGFEQVVSGSWPGSIATAARGAEGHGYDPIFVPEGLEVTAAQLTAEQKNAVSHRARAFDAAVPMLRMSLITD
ncbi:RdgB/HAM1 family non-canonical purine NTP pyrophosphatase [Herbiconiux sp.]|uniref:RdgB/HAM1 family non-canonical purine NTP pyrophosphatase n=1 Tax=Herbiconiux sp. TaxID=1871186 RepID=UPI0025BEBF42|nr:RdgB/HAM1 family non-canonical purine NTP pyrophosphatase [Herbiconiux sp.]